MTRRSVLPLPLLALALAVFAGCGALATPTSQDAMVGQDVVTAQYHPVSVAGALSRQQAVQKAAAFAPGAARGSPSAALVALTLRDTKGQIAWSMQARSVWLVLFPGLAYAPASAPDAGCACSQYANRPNTAVALDPASGAMVLTYGYSGG